MVLKIQIIRIFSTNKNQRDMWDMHILHYTLKYQSEFLKETFSSMNSTSVELNENATTDNLVALISLMIKHIIQFINIPYVFRF